MTRRTLQGPMWRRLFRDVYVFREVVMTPDVLVAATALLVPRRRPRGSHRGVVYGVDLRGRPDAPVEVVVQPGTCMRSRPGILGRESRLPAGHVTQLGTIRATSPLRTAFDLARSRPRADAVAAVDALARACGITHQALVELAAGLVGWRGVRQARAAFALIDVASESPMESRLRVLLYLAGLPAPVLQHVVRGRDGRFLARVDLAYADAQIAIEYDGRFHSDQLPQDLARQNALVDAGWLVLRYTAGDVYNRPGLIVEQVRRALAERSESNVIQAG